MKDIKITPPKGYEIDKENSTFDCIKFKPIVKRWRDDKLAKVGGWFISSSSDIINNGQTYANKESNYNVFATEKQAKSALAMARISQIMANDKRFGGVVTNKEWGLQQEGIWTTMRKFYVIRRWLSTIDIEMTSNYNFLAFHTKAQANLFLVENEDLVKDYFML